MMTSESIPEIASSEDTLYEVLSRRPTRGNLPGDLTGLFAVWDSLRDGAFAPAWSAFDMDAVPPRLVPWFAVVEVVRDPLDFVYRFWGMERTRLQGKDYTGRSVRDFRPISIANKAFAEYARVVDEKAPIYLPTFGMTDQKAEPFSYHLLRLPFSNDGLTVDHILGVGIYDGRAERRARAFYAAGSDGNA